MKASRPLAFTLSRLFTLLLHGGVDADSAEDGGGYRRDDFKDDGDVLFVFVSHFSRFFD